MAATLALALSAPSAFSAEFTLSSNALKPGAALGNEYMSVVFGCTGGNRMPDLAWKNPPPGTRSFAVTFYDRDAPTGSGFWHWVAYDIPSQTVGLPGGVGGTPLPDGAVEGNTDMGKPGFLAPCPQPGLLDHYVYTVYALKVARLPVEPGFGPALVGFHLWQNTIAKATLTVTAGPRK